MDLESILTNVDEEADTVAEPLEFMEPESASDDDDFETLFDAIQID